MSILIITAERPLILSSGYSVGSGSSRMNHVQKTANYNAVVNDFIEGDTSGAGFTVTLPALSTCAVNDIITINLRNSGATPPLEGNELIVEGNGSDSINSNLTDSLKVSGQVRSYIANSGLTDWIIV